MAVVKMDRLTLIGLTEDKSDIMGALMRLGAVELDEQSGLPSEAGESFDDRSFMSLNALSRLEIAVKYCREQDPDSHRLGSAKRTVSHEEFIRAGHREHEIMMHLRTFEQLEEGISSLRDTIAYNRSIQDTLSPWRDLDIDLAETMTGQTVLFMGVFPSPESLHAFQAEMLEESPETHVEICSFAETAIRVVVITLKSREGLVHGNLRQHGFHLLPTAGLSGTPAQILSRIEEHDDDDRRRLDRFEKERLELVAYGRDFELLHDFYLMRSDKIEVLRELPGTASTFYLNGWVPAKLSADLSTALSKKYRVAIETRQPTADEEPPVLLHNPALIKPFEMIVEMYAPPTSADIDPSPILAPFFFFFFGMMLSDIGYGAILAGLTGYFIFKKKSDSQMFKMLFISGIGSIIWGILFGGFFGDMLTVVSEGKIVVPSIWFNPMDDPMGLMIWSMVFGVIHLFTAMGVKVYMLAKNGQLFDGLVDIVPWYLVIVGLGFMIGGESLLPGGPLGLTGQVLAIAGAAVLLLFGGRDAKNPILRLLKGLMSLYNVTAYFSDILSYTRILALVLATSVIAMVVNKLGFMLGPTVGGYIMFTAVALFGHALNLALSALSAYVHTSRLHYVEFFSKFYEGGGKLFKPLKTRTRFVQLDRTK